MKFVVLNKPLAFRLLLQFHWPLQDVLAMEHRDRRQWATQIAEINRKVNEVG
jgi:hypothetical protein